MRLLMSMRSCPAPRFGLPVLGSVARRFWQARNGVAAIEFALIAPVMVTLLLAMTEVTVSVNTDRKLSLVTRTLADLTGRATVMTSNDMQAVFDAGRAVMQPYSAANGGFVISSIVVTMSGTTPTGAVAWSCANGPNAAKRTSGSPYTVPASFASAASFIVVESKMPYTPILGGQFTNGVINLNETLPWPVRNGTQVSWSGASC
jgi:Flp pilus assembly protein TadG